MQDAETARQISRAQAGDAEAFDWIVRRFQDMALAYAFSILGDYQLAQDAAQESFVEVYRTLHSLRVQHGFASWLRKIVFKHCDRLKRSKHVDTLPFNAAESVASLELLPEQVVERHELQEQVKQAIQCLPEGERLVTGLFYMGQYSHREIAQFLDISAALVKSRLYQARSRLKERLFTMVKDNLHENRPSRDDEFRGRVNEETTKLFILADSEKNIPAVTGEGDPLFALMGSIFQWAIHTEASDILVVPGKEAVSIKFIRGGVTEEVMTVPKGLEGALTGRIKMAADVDIHKSHLPQDGLMFILHNGIDYDAPVFCRPMEHGESIAVQLTRK